MVCVWVCDRFEMGVSAEKVDLKSANGVGEAHMDTWLE